MHRFNLPNSFGIIDGPFGPEAYELDPADPLQADDPRVRVIYAPGAGACMSGDEWVASIKRQAIAAYRRGDSEITVS